MLDGRTEQGKDGVAHKFVERALIFENDVDHGGKIGVQEPDEVFRVHCFRHGGEAANVRHEDGHGSAFTAHVHRLGTLENLVHEFRADITGERLPQQLLAPFFVPQAYDREQGGADRQRAHAGKGGPIHAPVVEEGPGTQRERCERPGGSQGADRHARARDKKRRQESRQDDEEGLAPAGPGRFNEEIPPEDGVDRQGMEINAGAQAHNGRGVHVLQTACAGADKNDFPFQAGGSDRAFKQTGRGDMLVAFGRTHAVRQQHVSLGIRGDEGLAQPEFMDARVGPVHDQLVVAGCGEERGHAKAGHPRVAIAHQEGHPPQFAVAVRQGIGGRDKGGGFREFRQRAHE